VGYLTTALVSTAT